MSHGQEPSTEETARANSIAARICAVVVTYFPDAHVVDRARVIADQVGAVVVVDNGSGPDCEKTLRSLSHIPGLTLLRNDANTGLATALNQGVGWAKDKGFAWALLFDQDSTPLAGMVEELARISQELGQEACPALIGSNFVDVNSNRAWFEPTDNSKGSWVHSRTMTTSGTLVPLAAFDALGPFRSDLFVDFVDMEYSLRARSRGHKVVTSVRPLMLHTIGAKRKRRILWRTVWPTYHPPLRRYYIARNTVSLLREYASTDPEWAIKQVLALAKSLVLILLFEDKRFSKLMVTGRGIIAGLRRNTVQSATEPPKVDLVKNAARPQRQDEPKPQRR
jgi:rhamnosyltransferase